MLEKPKRLRDKQIWDITFLFSSPLRARKLEADWAEVDFKGTYDGIIERLNKIENSVQVRKECGTWDNFKDILKE